MNRVKIYFFLCLVMALNSCRKDQEEVTTSPQPHGPDQFVRTTILGVIEDVNGIPLEGATVTIGDYSRTTDETGVYQFSDIYANINGTVQSIEKTGFLNLERTLFPELEKTTRADCRLIPKSNAEGNVFTTKGGEVHSSYLGPGPSADGQVKISFPPFAVKYQTTNQLYSGLTYKVYLKYISPFNPDFGLLLPGDHFFIDNKELKSIAIKGIWVFEIEDENGVPLEIDPSIGGVTMQLKYDKSSPQSTLSAFYLESGKGAWKHHAEFIKNGNSIYQTTLNKKGVWLAGLKENIVKVNLTLQDEKNVLLKNTLIRLSDELHHGGVLLSTNDQGNLTLFVPKNQKIYLSRFNKCNGNNIEIEEGPFFQDVTKTVILKNELQNKLILSGTVLDCSGSKVSQAYIQLTQNGNTEVYPIQGSFQLEIGYCNTGKVSIQVFNEDKKVYKKLDNIDITGGVQSHNLGNIILCNSPGNEFIKLTKISSKPILYNFEITSMNWIDQNNLEVDAKLSGANQKFSFTLDLNNPSSKKKCQFSSNVPYIEVKDLNDAMKEFIKLNTNVNVNEYVEVNMKIISSDPGKPAYQLEFKIQRKK